VIRLTANLYIYPAQAPASLWQMGEMRSPGSAAGDLSRTAIALILGSPQGAPSPRPGADELLDLIGEDSVQKILTGGELVHLGCERLNRLGQFTCPLIVRRTVGDRAEGVPRE